jgi:DNA recombination protein RmuC
MDGTSLAILLVALAVGLAIGGWCGAAVAGARAAKRMAAAESAARDAVARLEEARRGQSLLREELDSRASVEALLTPLTASLADVEHQLRTSERMGAEAHAALREQLAATRAASEDLRRETAVLTTALRAPHVRGRWGEQQLERVVELAGMVRHCDFSTQVTRDGADGVARPDLVVHLPGGKTVVVDAKVPFAGYLEAMEARDDAVRAQRRAAHARHVKDHINRLAAKSYWDRFESAPEFVVMFVPAEAFLVAALEDDPTLLEYGFAHNVVVATPSTLVALLRTVAYTWRQEAVTDNAREVLAVGRELHRRLAAVGEHVTSLGRHLASTVGAYNRAVGSIESRLLVTSRRLAELDVVDAAITPAKTLDEVPRPLTDPELAGELPEGGGASESPAPAQIVSLRGAS